MKHHRITASAMLIATGAVIAGGLATAVPAAAAPDKYVVIAYSSITKTWGTGYNYDTLDAAGARALNECSKAGGSHCFAVTWSKNGCSALAVRGEDYYGWYGPIRHTAEQEALRRNNGGKIVASQCATY